MSERNAKLIRKLAEKSAERAEAVGMPPDREEHEKLLKKLLHGSHRQRQRIRSSMKRVTGEGKAKKEG